MAAINEKLGYANAPPAQVAAHLAHFSAWAVTLCRRQISGDFMVRFPRLRDQDTPALVRCAQDVRDVVVDPAGMWLWIAGDDGKTDA